MTPLITDFREMFSELGQYRELLFQMTLRDLLLRYKQTIMGVGWAVFMPLINTAVFSVIFVRVAPIHTPVPYPVFAYCGLMVWNFFASSLKFSATSVSSNVSLVTKVFFPREILPFSSIVVCLVDLFVSAIVLVGLMWYYHVPASPSLAFLPLVLVVHVAFTAGIGLLLAMGNLFYRDVKYLFEIILTLWMFATAVLYPAEIVGGRLGLLILINPMTPIVDAYRRVILMGQSPLTPAFGWAAAAAAVTLTWCWLVFHRSEARFAENI